jgi:hypothetical protein
MMPAAMGIQLWDRQGSAGVEASKDGGRWQVLVCKKKIAENGPT